MPFTSKLLIDATSVKAVNYIAPKVREIVAHDGFESLSLAIPWKWFETEPGNFWNGAATARAGRDLAASAGVKFDLRVRAGAGTPAWRMGETYIPEGTPFGNPPHPDPAAGKTIPQPFKDDGTANTVILNGMRQLATQVGSLCAEGGYGMVHGTHPGGNSAEMYYTPETEQLPGHSYEQVSKLHVSCLAAWQNRIPRQVALEMPFGGLVGAPFIKLQKDVLAAMRAHPRQQFIQLNWLDDRPTPANGDTLTNFDTRMPPPPRHGMQLIHAEEYDWAKCCDRAEASGTEYVEWFFRQFSYPSTPTLYAQIKEHAS